MQHPRRKGITLKKYMYKKCGEITYIITEHAYKRYRQRISKNRRKNEVIEHAIKNFDNPGFIWIEDENETKTFWLVTVYEKAINRRQTKAGNI